MAHLSVVIPVYQAEACLSELQRRLQESLGSISEDYELVLVDDGSTDGSWGLLESLAQEDARIKAIRLSRNFGQQIAITAGLDHCDGDWVVVMDCDLQDRPEDIPKLYRKALDGHELVLARRTMRKDPLLKRATASVFYRVFNYLSGMPYDGLVGNFRIFSRRIAKQFTLMRENIRFFRSLMQWMGYPAVVVDIQHDPRFAGATTYSYRKLLKLGVETCIAYSDRPLRLAVQIGFLMAFFAFLGAGFITWRAIFRGIPVAGWGSLIVSVYFIGGMITSLLGVVGIYLGKTFDEVKGRPLYLVRRSANLEERGPGR